MNVVETQRQLTAFPRKEAVVLAVALQCLHKLHRDKGSTCPKRGGTQVGATASQHNNDAGVANMLKQQAAAASASAKQLEHRHCTGFKAMPYQNMQLTMEEFHTITMTRRRRGEGGGHRSPGSLPRKRSRSPQSLMRWWREQRNRPPPTSDALHIQQNNQEAGGGRGPCCSVLLLVHVAAHRPGCPVNVVLLGGLSHTFIGVPLVLLCHLGGVILRHHATGSDGSRSQGFS